MLELIKSLILFMIIVLFEYYLIRLLNRPEIGFVWWEKILFALVGCCYLLLACYNTERFWELYFGGF
ncbi:hypothetical protein GWI33_017429 [Rhynchophorus ferrugineus]|uniref:Uncharacterized protein n=1 Tax=Rhynchophorus ferrugineus TaxID=354439 RepID=A0A834M7N0_RHYFE|nr:hypothetical protein GWI33_017429 [Rhynchophorus ferrugineus]